MLAAQACDLIQVSATMLIVGAGVAVPLLVLGLLSREALLRWRSCLGRFDKLGKRP